MWSLLIRGGTVIDGSGAPGQRADLAIAGDRIAAIGPGLSGRGCATLDAAGLVLSPGFIDAHAHYDLSIRDLPDAPSAVSQGITSAVVGNCGLTAYPVPAAQRPQLERYLAPFAPGLAHGDWDCHSLDGFYRPIEQAGLALNLLPLVGQGSIRLAVLGYADQPADAAADAAMGALLDQALAQGAWGLSSGLLYPPGSYADVDELARLARRLRPAGALYVTHVRNEGDRLIASVDEALAVAERAGVALHIAHHKAVGRENWGRVATTLAALQGARDRGRQVSCDVWPYLSGSTTISALLPGWALVDGIEAALRRLIEPALRRRMATEIERGDLAGEALLRAVGYDGIVVAECPADPGLQGQSLTDIFRQQGRPASTDALFDLLRRIELRATMIIRDELSEDDLRAVIRSQRCCLGSDAWLSAPDQGGLPHPRTYGAFPQLFARFVRELGDLTIEQAVHKVSGLPAAIFGLRDRGLLRPGLAADVCLFDPGAIAPRATYQQPHQLAAGIVAVVVNGTLVVEAGHATGRRPGCVLRRPGSA